MTSEHLRGTRTLKIPEHSLTGDEYESLRNARRGGPGNPDFEVCYFKRDLETAASLLADQEINVNILLYTLEQPSPSVDISPEDVYDEQGGGPRFPAGGVRIPLDDVQQLKQLCEVGLQELESNKRDIDEEQYETSHRLLSKLEEFSENAIDLGVRPWLRSDTDGQKPHMIFEF